MHRHQKKVEGRRRQNRLEEGCKSSRPVAAPALGAAGDLRVEGGDRREVRLGPAVRGGQVVKGHRLKPRRADKVKKGAREG